MKIEQVEPKGYLKEILNNNKGLRIMLLKMRLLGFIHKIFRIKCKYKNNKN